MKNRFLLSLLLLFALSCSKEQSDYAPADGFDRVYSLLVVNEGKYVDQTGSGSVCRYTIDNNNYLSGIFGGVSNAGFGGAPCHATIWQDTLYVVSKNNNAGNVLSAYNNKTGAYLKGYKSDEGVQGSAFTVVNNKIGVLSTSGGGAIVIDMATLTAKKRLQGTSNSTGDLIVVKNNLYLIDNQEKILIYPLDGLETATPKTIEGAVGGFAVSKDGFLWAYDNKSVMDFEKWDALDSPTTLIKINTTTATQSSRTEIPNSIFKSFTTYYPGLIAASTSENTLFFIRTSELLSSTLYKYSIDRTKVESLHTLTNSESFKTIVYNPSNNCISAVVLKYGTYTGSYSILTIDAVTGRLKQRYDCINPSDAQKFAGFLLLDKTSL